MRTYTQQVKATPRGIGDNRCGNVIDADQGTHACDRVAGHELVEVAGALPGALHYDFEAGVEWGAPWMLASR